MGLMGRILGAGGAVHSVGATVTGVAEVFVGNRAEREAAEHAALTAAIGQFGAEFARPAASRFDGFMDGLNRLPRPLLVGGTLGLFVYAMVAPAGFSVRMQGLALVPEPLWWLLGAIVSFYFGARELHYRREGAPKVVPVAVPAPAPVAVAADAGIAPDRAPEPETETAGFLWRQAKPAPVTPAAAPASAARAAEPHFNAALEEWRRLRG